MRWIGAVQFSKHAGGSGSDGARGQYASEEFEPERALP